MATQIKPAVSNIFQKVASQAQSSAAFDKDDSGHDKGAGHDRDSHDRGFDKDGGGHDRDTFDKHG